MRRVVRWPFVIAVRRRGADSLKFLLLFGVLHGSLKGVGIGARIGRTAIDRLLAQTYFSQTPYLLGDRAVKYHAAPKKGSGCADAGAAAADAERGPDYLAEGLARDLAAGDARFVFGVQRQADDPATTPIEDPRVEWTTPVEPLAELLIPAQGDYRSDEARASCEPLMFIPWNSLPEHRPLGGINRIRNPVYRASAAERHSLNGVADDG
jgi:hypothetical protein